MLKDDDEFKPYFIPFENSNSSSSVTIGSIETNFATSTYSNELQRSKIEAVDRAQAKLAVVNRAFRGIPFLRPYVFSLNLLTYGLILVDPLDRLE